MRLIHYSKTPLLKVRSMKHSEDGCGAYKTPGLWVSVEGDDDWVAWCRGESWGLQSLVCATEIVLADDAKVHHLDSASAIDKFTAEFEPKDRRGEWDRRIMLIRLTHADTSARTIGIPEQSRSAPLEG